MIDYKLAKEIGATHYRECVDNEVDYYRLSYNGLTLLCYSKKCEEWDESLSTGAVVLTKIKPIPPKRTRTEYEKVTESIFDLRDEFERGELYKLRNDDTYEKITCESKLGELYGYRLIYRKVEKEIDWREDADSYFLKTKYLGIDCTIEEAITRSDYCDEFLELCRVALRANGEIE